MLYFQIKTARDANLGRGDIPTKYLCVSKSIIGNDDSIYQHDTGTNIIYYKYSKPSNWGDEAESCASNGKCRFVYSTEQILIKQGLFYGHNDYDEEFHTKKFADPLNIIYGQHSVFDEFDTGAIWMALVSINSFLSKQDNIVTPKMLNRIIRTINTIIVTLDHSIGFHSKLVRACKKQADLYPDSIKNVKEYCANKAYLMAAYLFLFQVKEFLIDRVVPEGTDLIMFLYECMKGITIHTYATSYDLVFNDPNEIFLDQIVNNNFGPKSNKIEEPKFKSINEMIKGTTFGRGGVPAAIFSAEHNHIEEYAEEKSKQLMNK